jgi:predicted nuclease with TOPRIM domain
MKAVNVVTMTRKDVDAFNVRFDKVIEGLTEIKVETSGIKEHLKTLNGKVSTHEQRFTDVYQEFKGLNNGRVVCQDNVRLELEKVKSQFAINNKEQDVETKNIEKMLWETKVQLAGIAVIVPIIISFLMWLVSKLF